MTVRKKIYAEEDNDEIFEKAEIEEDEYYDALNTPEKRS